MGHDSAAEVGNSAVRRPALVDVAVTAMVLALFVGLLILSVSTVVSR